MVKPTRVQSACVVDIFQNLNVFLALALAEKEKDAQKRHTMGHPPEHIPDLDSPRSRSPLKKDKKEKVILVTECLDV